MAHTNSKKVLFLYGGLVMQVDLILIDLQGLDIIFGMDFLATHHASMDCFRKEVTFKMSGLLEVVFQGDCRSSQVGLIYAFVVHRLLQKGCVGFWHILWILVWKK